jgi:lipopolysaccharide export system permease protein
VPIREYASALTPKELALQQATLWINFLSLAEVEKLQARFAEAGSGEFIKIKHRRLTTVVINMILLCLGMPFFLNRERVSVIIAGGQCLAMCGSCYVLSFLCHNVDMSGLGLNPALPAWLPVLVFGPLAVYLLDTIKT